MSMYLSDEEQFYLIINWFKKYGVFFILSLVIFLLVFFGISAWEDHKNTQTESASIAYERLLLTLQNHKKIDYPVNNIPENTGYGQLAMLLKTQEKIKQGNFPEAINNLNWVINHTQDSGLRQISRIRLARILLAQKKPGLTLEQLNKVDDATFKPLVDKVKNNLNK